MRHGLLALTIAVVCFAGVHHAAAQVAPADPGTLDPALLATVTQHAADAGYAYGGDCQTANAQSSSTVCSLVYPQSDGSFVVGYYQLADDGTYATDSFDWFYVPSPNPPVVIPPARLLIPKIGVDAPIVTLGIIPETNILDSPRTKDEVGYYDFTPVPNFGGNTVLSGHVDWYTGETGVFGNLKLLAPGDQVQLVMPDGTVYTYQVSDAELYDGTTAPLQEILDDSSEEMVTLITCEGVFDPSAAEYDKRRVVQAVRISP